MTTRLKGRIVLGVGLQLKTCLGRLHGMIMERVEGMEVKADEGRAFHGETVAAVESTQVSDQLLLHQVTSPASSYGDG